MEPVIKEKKKKTSKENVNMERKNEYPIFHNP